MSLGLLFPAALAGLLALLLPLLIHLARREEHTPLPFAALRWLQLRARPQRRIRISEWPLLLLRMLLLALLVLLLAGPRLSGTDPDTTSVIAIAPGLSLSQLPAEIPAGARRVWLAPGFAAVEDDAAPSTAQPLSSLLRAFDAQLPAGTALTVVVPAQLSGTDAQIPRLSRAVDWQIVPTTAAIADRGGFASLAPPTLVIRHDADAIGVRYLQAVQRAWTPEQDADIGADTIAVPRVQAGQVLVWLSAAPVPAQVRQQLQPGSALLLDARQPGNADSAAHVRLRDAEGRPLIEQQRVQEAGVAQLRFTTALQPASFPLLLDAEFPARLREVLQPVPVPHLVDAIDHAPLTGASAPVATALDLSPWLIALIALLFALERWLATRKQRWVSA